ncbi:MAG: hypothetical protein FWC16_15110 [Defluviitaleaceae bacterium]|nr:hypothetical protein [Defluviitaleaceae bacterium]MCL2276243.1 hypothetical protein [Defluviitaleaceae bacterium]
MRDVLNELLEMEYAAQSEYAEAQNPPDEDDARLQAEITQGTAKIRQDMARFVSEASCRVKAETEARLAQIAWEYAQKTQALEDEFTQNHEVWLEKIVRDVLYP